MENQNPIQNQVPPQPEMYQQPVTPQQPVFSSQPAMQPAQPQFQPQGIPAEVPSSKSGKVLGILSVVFGALSIVGTIFTAPIGIILGAISIAKGEKTLGLTGIILSVVFMVLAFTIYFLIKGNDAAGLMLPIFSFLQ